MLQNYRSPLKKWGLGIADFWLNRYRSCVQRHSQTFFLNFEHGFAILQSICYFSINSNNLIVITQASFPIPNPQLSSGAWVAPSLVLIGAIYILYFFFKFFKSAPKIDVNEALLHWFGHRTPFPIPKLPGIQPLDFWGLGGRKGAWGQKGASFRPISGVETSRSGKKNSYIKVKSR